MKALTDVEDVLPEGDQSQSTNPVAIPTGILKSITDVAGSRVVLVVGAGVSMEKPTDFASGAYYSREAYRRLVADGVLNDGECTDPDDLSVLADLLYDKFGSQAELTSRLPKDAWRTATPNSGHLIAAALLIEGAIRHVITLNYDLAFQHAVTSLGNSTNITFVEGPDEHANLASHSVVHLHRSVNQPEETWVLRKSVLDADWAAEWESVIATANLTAPVVVFVGLGSPAKVLTESVSNLAAKAQSSYYLIDRNQDSKFHEALSANLTGTVDLNWGDFMSRLANRLVLEQLQRVRDAHSQMVDDEPEMALRRLEDVTTPIQEITLLDFGRARATWLLSPHSYLGEGDAANQGQIAHLLVAIDHLSAALATNSLDLDEHGRFAAKTHGGSTIVFGLAHGRGTNAWSAISAKIRERNKSLAHQQRTNLVIVAGARHTRMPNVDDLVRGDTSGDLIRGADSIHPIFADDYIGQPATVLQSVIEGLRR